MVKQNSRNAFFIIAGNPPALHFYELWKKDILNVMPDANVCLAAYPEISAATKSKEAMQEISSDLAKQLKNFSKSVGAPITILGHSLGGYFGYEILKIYPLLVTKLYLIHPFLRTPTKQGQKILGLLRLVQEKEFLCKTVIRSRHWLAKLAPELVFLENQELSMGLNLARHEHYTIAQDRSPLRVPIELQDKITMFFIPGDTWCAPRVVNEMQSQIKLLQVTEPHAFIVSRTHRESLIQKVIVDSAKVGAL